MKKILVVDDSPVEQSNLKVILKDYKLIFANDGKEGLALFKKHQNNLCLILCDQNMPHVDGIEFMSTVRNTNKEIPLVFMTSECGVELRDQAVEAGADVWLIKPLNEDKVKLLVGQLFEKKVG